jgi:hypothetical protein
MNKSELFYNELKEKFPVSAWQKYGFAIENSEGVKIEDFLQSKGFEKTIETQDKKKWETFRNPNFDFAISIREKSERKADFPYTATVLRTQ